MKHPRVLYLVPDLIGSPGGIARQCRSVCRAISEAGIPMSVLALNDPVAQTESDRRWLGSAQYRSCDRNRWTFIRDALLSVRQGQSFVILGHVNFAPLGWLVARLSGARFVIFIHGIDAWERLPLFKRLALGRADRVIAVSQFTARRAGRANGISPRKIRVLHNCLDPDLVIAQPNMDRQPALTLLTVARLNASERYKGHDMVIRSMPGLLELFPDLCYDVIGSGDDQVYLETLARREGVADAVKFHGAVSDEELGQHYAGTSLFVMPSRGEGFGIVFLEAMAHGKAVVAGNQDASVEVVQHGETGLVIDPTDLAQLRDAIACLLSQPALREAMGRKGAEAVATQFSFPAFQSRLLAYLQELAGEVVIAKGTPHS